MHDERAFPLAWLVLVAVAVGCAPASGSARVTGTVVYRERIAIAPDAQVRVVLEIVSRADAEPTILAERTIRPAGQVPVPFVLEYDPARIEPGRRYVVRAEIRDAAGALRWTTVDTHPVQLGGAAPDVEIVVRQVGIESTDRMSPGEPQSTSVYECEGLDFVVRQGPGEVGLFLTDRTVVAPQVAAASGAKYAVEDVVFWSKGDEATLEIGGRRWTACRLAPARVPWEDARLRGVAFRALGNEPGWTLEIEPGQRMVFLGDYGATRVTTPVPAPAMDPATGRTTYHATTEAHDLEVLVDDEPCADDMSGELFEVTVTVRSNERTYHGCGRHL